MRKTFKNLKCHPKHKTNKSCMNNKLIIKMRDKWNSRHPDKIIKTKTPHLIETQLRSYISICNDQKCIMDNTFGKSFTKTAGLFAPNVPDSWNTSRSEWLDSLDILRVMKQYEEAYPNFEFLGPTPIDFDSYKADKCVWPEICNLNIKDQLKKHNKIGIIFNLDPHYKEGSHWVSMFIDLEHKYILYFDSSGYKMPKEIQLLIDNVVKQCKELNINMKLYDNENIRHQYTDGECGIYCLYTIITLLVKNHSIKSFLKHKIPDDKMNAYRHTIYNYEL